MDGEVLAGRPLAKKKFLVGGGFGRDFGGLTFQGTSLSFWTFGREPEGAIVRWVDLVKRCDFAGSEVLIQLESLILAQSERWRQA